MDDCPLLSNSAGTILYLFVILKFQVNWHVDVINCLLNHGADVNKLTDEGCSALSAGCLFFYPMDCFRYNIAERYLEEPKDLKIMLTESKSKASQQQKEQQPSQAPLTPKSILSKKQGRKGSTQKLEVESHSDAGDSEKQMKNLQNVKQQVRIEDNSSTPVVTTVTQVESQGDQEDFDSTLSLKYFEIEVSDQLIERCATQLSCNEKVVGGRRSHNSADLGTARHLAVIKNE